MTSESGADEEIDSSSDSIIDANRDKHVKKSTSGPVISDIASKSVSLPNAHGYKRVMTRFAGSIMRGTPFLFLSSLFLSQGTYAVARMADPVRLLLCIHELHAEKRI